MQVKKLKLSSLIIIVLCVFFLTGCKKDVEIVNVSNKKGNVADKANQNINVKGNGTLKCTRSANAINDLKAEFNYFLTYEKGIITNIHSIEKVIGEDKDGLDQYEEAYNKIKKKYDNLKYYDFTVSRDKTSVTNDIVINFKKVDIDKIIEIEGNNIYDKKKRPSLKKWLALGKKAGLTCEGVDY